MRGRSAVWTGSRIGWKASARAASLIWHLVRLLWRLARWAGDDRGRAGGFVTRTALRHRTETLLLAALALLAAWGDIAATGALELLLAIACLALCLGAWGSWQVAGRYSVGAASERAVAKRLRLLERSGWFVLHDLERPRAGNVDHLAAGPGGAFTIETKTIRYSEADLRQAFDHARWAEARLRLPVTPVLCLARRRDPPYEDHGVVVCGATELASFLARQPGPPADTGHIARRLTGSRRSGDGPSRGGPRRRSWRPSRWRAGGGLGDGPAPRGAPCARAEYRSRAAGRRG